MSDTDLNKLKVVELRAELSSRDLETKGNKAALVKRLREAINKEKGIVGAETTNEEADEGDGDTSQDETLDMSATETPVEVEEPPKSIASEKNARAESVKKETPKKEPSNVESPKKEPAKTETPKKEPTKAEAPKKEPAKVEIPKKEPAKVEIPKKEPAKAETPKKEPAKTEAPKKEPVKTDTPKKDPAKTETPKKEPPKVETPKKDSPKVEPAKKDLPKVASPKATTPKKEAAKVEMPKKESSKVEVKKETVVVESPKTEAPKIDSPQEPAKAETTTKKETPIPESDVPQEDLKSCSVKLEDVAMEVKEEHNTEGTEEAKAENGVEASQEEAQPMEVEGTPDVDASEKPPQGEKRQRSGSRTPDRKKNRSHSRDKKKARSQSPFKVVEDEDDTFDDALLTLDTYNSDLNLCIDKTRYAAAPLTNDGFGFMWAGARATYGFKEGKIAFEVKVVKHMEARRLPEDEPNPHVVRVGFSVSESTLQLGEDPLSYGYGGTGKASCNCQFKDYGTEFKEEDVITAFLNLDVDPLEISFAKNGEHLGIAYGVPKEELGDRALFPHVLSKNCSFEVNFGQKEEQFFKFPEEYADYTFVHLIEADKRIHAPKAPSKRDECEMLMLCGLPGSGKTTWATNYCSLHPEKNYNIIGTNSMIDKMKVMGLPRKRNYAGRWDVLIENSTRCLNRVLELGSRRRRNYILDQAVLAIYNNWPGWCMRNCRCELHISSEVLNLNLQ